MSLIEVSREQFFAYIGPRDVSPYPERDCSVWRDRAMKVVGRSLPGFGGRDGEPHRYFLRQAATTGDSSHG